MSTADIPLSTSSLVEALHENVPATAERPCCDYYYVLFGNRAELAGAEGRDELTAAFRFLGMVTSLRLTCDDPRQPFQPLLVIHGARSTVLDEITDDQIEALAKVAANASDPELRARLADLVWVRKRDHQLAQLAVSAYVESGKRILIDPLSSSAIDRFERALQIGAMLGKEQPPFGEALAVVEEVASSTTESGFAVARCLDLILQYSKREPERFARVAESRATSEESSDQPIWQRRFWELAARFYDRADEEQHARRSRLEVAKTFELEADQALKRESPPTFLVASCFLQNAIQAYRRVPGTEAERERVHLRLLECQPRGVKELPRIDLGPVDLSDAARRAREAVSGKPLAEALRILALSGQSPRLDTLRGDAEQEISRYPLAFLFPASTLSSTGKVVAKQGTMSSGSEEDRESLIRRQMYWYSSHIHRPLHIVGQVEPMRYQILADHYVRHEDLLPFVAYNTLVPAGREPFYLQGLYAGLQGNFFESLHVLIPQFENSVRCLLSERGIIVSTLDSNGLQRECDLNALLYEPRLNEIFAEDIIFDMRGLLVEQAGSNFRNQLAHGMLEYGAFLSDTAVYIWWLILRLCVLATLPRPASSDSKQGT